MARQYIWVEYEAYRYFEVPYNDKRSLDSRIETAFEGIKGVSRCGSGMGFGRRDISFDVTSKADKEQIRSTIKRVRRWKDITRCNLESY